MTLKHAQVAGTGGLNLSDDPTQSGKIQPSDWDADHIYDIAVTLGAYQVLTNVGAAYDTVANAKGLGIALVDMTGIDTIEFRVFYNKIGTGTLSWQLWNQTDGAQVGVITDAAAAGDNKLGSAQITGLALSGLKVLRVRAQSTNAADDPVFYGAALLLRQTG